MRSNNYKDYLKRSFMRYAMVIILIMFVLFLAFMVANIQFTTVRTNHKSNNLLAAFFEAQSQSLHAAATELAASPTLPAALLTGGSAAVTQANKLLYGFSTARAQGAVFVLLDKDRQIRCSNLYQGNRAVFSASPMIHSVLEKLEQRPQEVYSSVSRLNYDNGQACDLLFAKAVTDGAAPVGYLFLDLREATVYEFVRTLAVDQVMVTDKFDNIIFTTLHPVADPMEKYPPGKYRPTWKGKRTVLLHGKRYYAHATVLPGSGLQIYTLTTTDLQRQMLLYGVVFLLLMSAVLIGLVLLLTKTVARRNLSSIDELVAAVELLGQENLGYRIEVQTFHEFQTLYSAFNSLLSRLQELMQRNTELAEHKWRMEIKHLEEQFNPHFVFNVLETLRYEIVIDPHRASDMVVSFANLMRYSINHGNTTVPLQTDIEYINDYLLLQKIRYNKRLEYHISIDQELLHYNIPKLLLQPIVENSLNHGAEKTRFMRVDITGTKQGNCLVLCVEDNGSGIEPERLQRLREALQAENTDPTHVGLYNANRAMQLLYGMEYGLTLESSPGTGTKVTLRIPIEGADVDV